MESSARENYLATEVLTATPQKLHLMLVDAAIRSAQRARQQLREGQNDFACQSLVRAQDIVSQLVAGLNHESGGELVSRMAGIYLFVFRTLVEANMRHDEGKLNEALRVLETERETWRQVCEQHPVAQGVSSPAIWVEDGVPQRPHTPAFNPSFHASDSAPPSGFSLEA